MNAIAAEKIDYPLKAPKGLSPRIQWLRDYYFQGAKRAWNNEFTAWSTGTPWDLQYQELTYDIVPEVYLLLDTMRAGYHQAARDVPLCEDFWKRSLPERRVWFIREVMVNHVPQEILPGELIAGARFNIVASLCLTKSEQRAYDRMVLGKKGARARMKWFHDHGYGKAGATCGHLVPGYERVLKIGWQGILADLETRYRFMSQTEQEGPGGAQLRAMMTAATMPGDLASKYADLCLKLTETEKDADRRSELRQMAANLNHVPWQPPRDFWEAVQSLWMTHMLVMSDEGYPGPGVSFGRIDQYLLPFWQTSKARGMDREFAKEILKCFWIHCNTAYDATIRNGHQGITAGYGQLITLSGLGPGARDMTNELTYMLLEVIDEMTPVLEPKPNVRLHRNSPEALMDKVVDMVAVSQGAPQCLFCKMISLSARQMVMTRMPIGLPVVLRPKTRPNRFNSFLTKQTKVSFRAKETEGGSALIVILFIGRNLTILNDTSEKGSHRGCGGCIYDRPKAPHKVMALTRTTHSPQLA